VPFAFSGMAIGTYLAIPSERAGRLYAFDLGAAALGCLASMAVTWVGLERLTAAACVLVVCARLLLHRPRRATEWTLAGAAALASLLAVASPDRLLTIKPVPGSMLSRVVEGGGRIVETRWDPAARIEVAEAPAGFIPNMFRRWPALTGQDPALLAEMRSFLTQNNYAFTLMVDSAAPAERFREGVRQTIYSAGYVAVETRSPHPKAMVVGVGGGFDVLTALANGASSVTGVEINGATLAILRDRYQGASGHFLNDPRVRLEHADGRHFIARSQERFDVIQLSGVDSYSGAQAGAHVFSETYLYTVEAMKAYLEHLTPGGVLNVMRLEQPQPQEVLRIVSTYVTALRELGVEDPARHIVCLQQRNGFFVAALVSLQPFSPSEIEHLASWADGTASIQLSADALSAGASRSGHEDFLRAAAAGREDQFRRDYPAIIWPATDDWPFFFQFSRWGDLIDWLRDGSVRPPVLPIALSFLALLLGALMLLTVITPLVVFARRGLRMARPVPHIAYFALLGLAFLTIELFLMQRLALLLGGPGYSVTVVLMTLLLGGGLGSASSPWLLRTLRGPLHLAFLLAGVALLLPALDEPLRRAITLGLPARIAVAAALTAPLGFLMGVWFPLGLDHLKATVPELVPWAWGVNGVFSVLAPILAIASATTIGETLTFLSAVPMYLAAGVIATRLRMWSPT
jgi:spermidine synthase